MGDTWTMTITRFDDGVIQTEMEVTRSGEQRLHAFRLIIKKDGSYNYSGFIDESYVTGKNFTRLFDKAIDFFATIQNETMEKFEQVFKPKGVLE